MYVTFDLKDGSIIRSKVKAFDDLIATDTLLTGPATKKTATGQSKLQYHKCAPSNQCPNGFLPGGPMLHGLKRRRIRGRSRLVSLAFFGFLVSQAP